MILSEVHTKCKNSLGVPREPQRYAAGTFSCNRSQRTRNRSVAAMVAADDEEEWEPRAEPRNRGSRGRPRFRGVLGEVRATSGEPPESINLQVSGRGPVPSAG